jgi:hypothetical protein
MPPALPRSTVRGNFQQLAQVNSDVIKTIGVLLAVGAAEQEITTIPALFRAIGSAGGAATKGAAATGAAAVGATFATAAAAALVAAGLLYVGVDMAIRAHDTAARDRAWSALRTIKEAHLAHYLEHFDMTMNHVREILTDRLNSRYKLNERLMRQDRVTKALADLSSLKNDIQDAMGPRALVFAG